MPVTTNDKLLAYLALFTGLAISAVAIYYSVSGLVSIFAAAVIPIIVMGVVLEVGKLVATLWLKQNWKIAPTFIKSYLLIAVVILMFITSMGIFGFLSRAHIEQSLSSGDNTIVIAEIDRQIEIERRIIQDSETVIKQLDQSVQVLTDTQRIRGSGGAIAVRKSQASERESLNTAIRSANTKISELEKEKLPLLKEQLNLEAEVGPIKYIAAIIYGDNPDKDLLESAVRWVIIVIVIIFDPLAVILLLASQYSFQYIRQQELEQEQNKSLLKDNSTTEEPAPQTSEPEGLLKELSDLEKYPYLTQPFTHFKNLKPMVYVPEPEVEKQSEVKEDIAVEEIKEEPEVPKEEAPVPKPEIAAESEEKNYIVKEGEKQIKMVYVPSKKHE
jgi:hypothetical protein